MLLHQVLGIVMQTIFGLKLVYLEQDSIHFTLLIRD
jgi:hypothetical protein